jgi:hypothetical protein
MISVARVLRLLRQQGKVLAAFFAMRQAEMGKGSGMNLQVASYFKAHALDRKNLSLIARLLHGWLSGGFSLNYHAA